jgi:hypothetical protein
MQTREKWMYAIVSRKNLYKAVMETQGGIQQKENRKWQPDCEHDDKPAKMA